MKYCDSCLTVAYDNLATVGVGDGPDALDEQEQFLDTFSGMAMLEDHLCDRIETAGEIPCKCKDHR